MAQQLDRDELIELACAGETDVSRSMPPERRYQLACRRVAVTLGRGLTDDERLTLRGLYTPGSKLVEPALADEGVDKLDREVLLELARDAVMRGREEAYGSPESSFTLIAKFWSAFLEIEIGPADVAAMMGLLKIARVRNDPAHEDSWVDLAGYAANGYEVSRDAAKVRGDE